jgi:hypothetical protein
MDEHHDEPCRRESSLTVMPRPRAVENLEHGFDFLS